MTNSIYKRLLEKIFEEQESFDMLISADNVLGLNVISINVSPFATAFFDKTSSVESIPINNIVNGSLIDYVVIDLKGYHFFVSRALAEEIEKRLER